MVGMRSGGGVLVHCMGADALASFSVAAEVMDKKLGTNYRERVENYRRHLQKNDLALTGAITDVRDTWSLHPSQQKQHKDFYLKLWTGRRTASWFEAPKSISAHPPAPMNFCASPAGHTAKQTRIMPWVLPFR